MSVDEYVIFNRKILKLVGLYPINLLRYFACISSIFLIVVPQICLIYLSRNDVSVLLETSSVLLTILLTIAKSFVWLRNGEATRLTDFLLSDYWRITKGIDANDRMRGYAKTGRNVTRGYSFLIVNALLVFFTLQPLNTMIKKIRGNHHRGNESLAVTKHFPFPAVYPKFCYESPYYEITYGSQTLATGYCGLLVLAMDTLIATALFHNCGHLRILHDNLLSLNTYIEGVQWTAKNKVENATKSSPAAWRNVNERTATLVHHHQLIIRFSDSMEKAFSPILFLQVSASSLLICLVGFQLFATTSKSYRLVEYFSYLLMALFQILLFCWPGDKVISHSLMIGNAAFSVNWYNAPNHVKTAILLIILRSQRPNCLTAGKFYKMCMESFATILNTSLSYFMLLRSVRSD